jgi:hypothetical protein
MKWEKELITRTEVILRSYESDGADAAFKLWQELDRLISGKRNMLSREVLDLVLQLEFFMENHPETEWNDVVNTFYLAKKSLETKKGR